MREMINKFEDLSVELILEIFDYLTIDDCFHGFSNLNKTINSALKLTGLSIDLTAISREKFHNFYEEIIFRNYRRQIRKLKISNDLTLGLLETFFNNYNLRDFKQLRSLILIKPSYITLGTLALSIPHLKQLEHVSIESNSYPESFFQSVTKTIKACYLPGFELQDEISFQSNTEYLTITVENITLLLNLFEKFPQLKYLNVSVRLTMDIDENALPIFNPIPCKNLQKFKLQILEGSMIDFLEIEYLFQQTSFPRLQSFSYHCTAMAFDHTNVTRWSAILSKHLSTIEKFLFFVRIPCNSCSDVAITQIFNDMKTQLRPSFQLFLSMSYSHYIIHTDIYPRTHLDLPMIVSNEDDDDSIMKYPKINSLFIDCDAISTCMMIPKNIKYLQLQSQKNDLNVSQYFRHCSKELLTLKIFGLPDGLPSLPNLRQLTIQKMMFNLNMTSKLSSLCPRLELLTIEIDCIAQFGNILDRLRCPLNLTELKFLRIFSRDPHQTWTTWLDEIPPSATIHNVNYEVKNLFLFIWF